MLVLAPLRVEAPPFTDLLPYATTIRSAIRAALRRDGTIRSGDYRAVLNVWVSPSGRVERSQFLTSTGDTRLDGAIINTMQNVTLDEAPPANLPQPVHVWILTGSERRAVTPFDVSSLSQTTRY
jgi:TonB family protein